MSSGNDAVCKSMRQGSDKPGSATALVSDVSAEEAMRCDLECHTHTITPTMHAQNRARKSWLDHVCVTVALAIVGGGRDACVGLMKCVAGRVYLDSWAGACGILMAWKQVGHSIWAPAAFESVAMCCPQTGQLNLISLISAIRLPYQDRGYNKILGRPGSSKSSRCPDLCAFVAAPDALKFNYACESGVFL